MTIRLRFILGFLLGASLTLILPITIAFNSGRSGGLNHPITQVCLFPGFCVTQFLNVSLGMRVKESHLPYVLFVNLGVSAWFWGTVMALVFCLWRPIIRRKPSDVPRCGRCGYELTGTVSDRCPECRTPIE